MKFSRSVAFLSTSVLILICLCEVKCAPACGENWWNKIKPSEKSCMLGHLIEVLSHLLTNNQPVCQCQCNKSPTTDLPVGSTKLPVSSTSRKPSVATEEPDFCDDDALSLGFKKSTSEFPSILTSIINELNKSTVTEGHQTTRISSTTDVSSSYSSTSPATTDSPTQPEETSTNPSGPTIDTGDVTTTAIELSTFSAATEHATTTTEISDQTTIGIIPSEANTLYPEETTTTENEATTLGIIPSSLSTTTSDITPGDATTINIDQTTTEGNEATTLGIEHSSAYTTTDVTTEDNEITTPSEKTTTDDNEATTLCEEPSSTTTVSPQTSNDSIDYETTPHEVTTGEEKHPTTSINILTEETTTSSGISTTADEIPVTWKTTPSETTPAVIVTSETQDPTPGDVSTDTPITWHDLPVETTEASTPEELHTIPSEISTSTQQQEITTPSEINSETPTTEIYETVTPTLPSDEISTTPSEYIETITPENTPIEISDTTPNIIPSTDDDGRPIFWGTPEVSTNPESIITTEKCEGETLGITPDEVTTLPPEISSVGTESEQTTLGSTISDETTPIREITTAEDLEKTTLAVETTESTTPSVITSTGVHETTLGITPSDATTTTPDIVSTTGTNDVTSLGTTACEEITVTENVETTSVPEFTSRTGTSEVITLGTTAREEITVPENVETTTAPCTELSDASESDITTTDIEETTDYFTTRPPVEIDLNEVTIDSFPTIPDEISTEPGTITTAISSDITTPGITVDSDATPIPSNALETNPTTENEISLSTSQPTETTPSDEITSKIPTDSPGITNPNTDNESPIVETPIEITGIPVGITITEKDGKTTSHKIISPPKEWEETTDDTTDDEALSLSFIKTSTLPSLNLYSPTDGNVPSNTGVTIDDAETLGNTPAEVYTTPIERTTTYAPEEGTSEHSPIIFPTDTDDGETTTLEETTSVATPSENTPSATDETETPQGSVTTLKTSPTEIITPVIDYFTITESPDSTTDAPATSGIPTGTEETACFNPTGSTIHPDSFTTETADETTNPGLSTSTINEETTVLNEVTTPETYPVDPSGWTTTTISDIPYSSDPSVTTENPVDPSQETTTSFEGSSSSDSFVTTGSPEDPSQWSTTTPFEVSTSSDSSVTTGGPEDPSQWTTTSEVYTSSDSSVTTEDSEGTSQSIITIPSEISSPPDSSITIKDATTEVGTSSSSTQSPSTTNACADEDCNTTTCEDKPRVLLVPVVEYKGPCLTEQEFRNYLGSCFEGQWQNGKRHGLGVETRGRWIYRGEWTQGFKGRYGVRQSNTSTAKYEGTWANGLQDGYGSETYADDGTYQGQWMRGMRHGYGIRTSAPFGKASKYRANKNLRASLTSLRSTDVGNAAPPEAVEKRDRRADDARGGFVLKKSSAEPQVRRRSLGSGNIKKGLLMGLKLKKQRSTGDLEGKRAGTTGSIRSAASTASWMSSDSVQSGITNASIPSDSNASFVVEDEQMDPNVTETYMGEWKNDKRSGYGISERSDGLKYEGEWFANKKYGYGVTTFSNGDKEEGKYKNNVLITSSKRKLFLMRSAKFRERIDGAVNAAQRSSKIALQKADIAITRTATARGKGEQADMSAAQAREDSDVALAVAKQYAPDFKQPGLERLKQRQLARSKVNNEIGTATLINDVPKQNEYNRTAPNPNGNLGHQMGNSVKPPTYYNQNYPQQERNESEQYQYQQNRLNPSNSNDASNPYGKTNLNPHLHEFGPQIPNNVDKLNNESAFYNKPRNSVTIDGPSNNPDVQGSNSLRRMSRRVSGDRPYLGNIGQKSSIDHFDHYKRPPSRDSSVDRYSRATGRLSATGSRQTSIDRSIKPSETPDRTIRAPSIARGATPVSSIPTPNFHSRNGGVLNASSSSVASNSGTSSPPFEDIIIRKRGLGQDIIPSPNQPKRTESLFIPGGGGGASPSTPKNLVTQTSLSRKKSLPDVQELPRATYQMSREEVSALGSARREEVRRQIDEKEKLRANPLLWLVSPQVKDWISRQQLVIVVLFVNVCLAIMFFKMLT